MITRYCAVHASDSFITEVKEDGTAEVKESEKTKIVRVPPFRGAMAYWGLATYDKYGWSTLNWLNQKANEANKFRSAEDFADDLNDSLNKELSRMNFAKPLTKGIGIHLTVYERIEDYWIPELFALTNYANTSYDSLHDDGSHCTRQTYNTIHNTGLPQGSWIGSLPEHRDPSFRKHVFEKLKGGAWLIYNNGDPMLFNPVAKAILDSIQIIAQRGDLRNPNDLETYRNLAKLTIEVVCQIQQKLVRGERIHMRGRPHEPVLKGKRRIGGNPHVLAVTPTGQYSSDTRD